MLCLAPFLLATMRRALVLRALASPASSFSHLTLGGWAPRDLTLCATREVPSVPCRRVYASCSLSSCIVLLSWLAPSWSSPFVHHSSLAFRRIRPRSLASDQRHMQAIRDARTAPVPLEPGTPYYYCLTLSLPALVDGDSSAVEGFASHRSSLPPVRAPVLSANKSSSRT